MSRPVAPLRVWQRITLAGQRNWCWVCRTCVDGGYLAAGVGHPTQPAALGVALTHLRVMHG